MGNVSLFLTRHHTMKPYGGV